MKLLSKHSDYGKLLAAALRENQTALIRDLYLAVREKSCASWKEPQEFEDVEEWGRSMLATAVDLLAAWFETGDAVYHELFAGWVHSRLAADLSAEGAPSDYKPDKGVELVKGFWVAKLKSTLPAQAIQILEADLDGIVAFLSKPSLKQPRVLFIGDCIQFEVMTALIGPCVRTGISIKPSFIPEHVQALVRNRIRTFGADDFDLVFFSPFSHSYLPEYEVLLKPESCFWPAAKIERQVETMLAEVYSTLDALAKQFNCPVYVHNTAGIPQLFGKVSGIAKNLISRRTRGQARERINAGIARCLEQPQRESRVHLLDENALLARRSEFDLGRIYLNSHAFHPTRLGVELGRTPYFEAVYANVFLKTKKVVVCDLDNTLWEGVIGEGAVTHYLERQATLKELRRRGVLLSINSKNDPKNIHWSGAALQADDFVAPRINWESKTANMAGIRDELNLKTKDFVFIDDRPDELERMRNAFPEILVMDATHPETWNFLAHWQRSLPSTPQEDRTKLYHERVQREEFLSSVADPSVGLEDEKAALAALNLTVKIEFAGGPALKRAAELINRTNQFNLSGSRTTVRDLEDGLGTDHWVLTAEAADKFGTMGVVGVMRVDRKQDSIEVPIFVLSCRVFGFGIEYALLNSVKRLVPVEYTLVGHFKETQFNQPCRQLYPASRMHWDGTNWVGRIADLPSDPEWLTIENRIAVRPQTPVGS